MLVHLDGEYRGVAVLVVVFGNGLCEGIVQMLEAMREDVGEAHHDGRGELAFLEPLHHIEQIDLAGRVHVGANHQVPGRIHTEIALAPGVDLVELGGVVDGPGDGALAPQLFLPVALGGGERLIGVGSHFGAHDIK